ncbi:MAG: glycoside hydrolase family 2 TIM barrel-domain containing protein, partial [Hungatella sp.]
MRTTIDLNREWEFALNREFQSMTKADAESLCYLPVTLPHDWVISSPFNRNMEQGEAQGFRDRWGTGWYRRNLWISEKEAKIYRLCFDGIYENSTVWVNGVLVGGRKYGYSSFSIDITDALEMGENKILVRVDNTAVPADRWYSGAGIYRKVYLRILPQDHLDPENIKVYTELDGTTGKLTVDAGIRKPVSMHLQKDDRKDHADSLDGRFCLEVQDCMLWSAENPELYHLTLELLDDEGAVADQITMEVGFRNAVLLAETGLRVNGEPIKLKGVCLHQEAGCFGTAVSKEIWRERLLSLKEIGCNALRLAHHIFMPEILELCDEIGFYVYEECFDKWTGGSYGRYYAEEWERDLSCMVKRDRNHPSILFWGVGNEVENQAYDSMLTMLENHVKKVKELDPTRYVSLAMNPHFAYPTEEVDMSTVKDIQSFVDDMKTGEIFDMDDRVERIKCIAKKVDFLCCNYQEQWYERIHKAIPDKAILGSETYMYFRGYEENFQNFSDVNPWLDVEEKAYCIGGMIWSGIDYLGESMGYPAKGWSGALFATDMEKRPIAWLYQSYWTTKPMVHFAVMDYSIMDEGVKEHWDYPRYVSHWEFPQFQKTVIPYMVATNCEEIRILINEKEFLVKPVKEFPNRMVTGFLPYMPGTVTIIGKNGGEEV